MERNQPVDTSRFMKTGKVALLSLLLVLVPLSAHAQFFQQIRDAIINFIEQRQVLQEDVAAMQEQITQQQTQISGLTRQVSDQGTELQGLSREVSGQVERFNRRVTEEINEQQEQIGGLTRQVFDQGNELQGLSREVSGQVERVNRRVTEQEQVIKARLGVARVERSRQSVELAGSIVAAEVTGLLAEAQSTATTGDNVSVDPDDGLEAIDAVFPIITTLSDVSPFDSGSLTNNAFLPDAQLAAADLNEWINELDLLAQRARLRLQVLRAAIVLKAGSNVSALEYLQDFVVGNLMEFIDVSSGQMFQQASASLEILSDKIDASLEADGSEAADDAQLANIDLQNMIQKQQQALQMIANVAKVLNDLAMVNVRNFL